MDLLNRLFFQFAKANKKNGSFILVGSFLMILFASTEVKFAKNISPSLLVCFAAIVAVAVTFLIYWPLWFLMIRKEARRASLSFYKFVMSDAYKIALAKYSASLEDVK